jgi:endonuclease YncB( thermonuclease family)
MNGKMQHPDILLTLILVILPISAHAWSGKVVNITDEDSIIVLRKKEGFMGYLQTPIKIRLCGTDCPEKGQSFLRLLGNFAHFPPSGGKSQPPRE